MSCEVKYLGCYSHCGALEFPLKAKASGIHSVVWDWQNVLYKVDFAANEGYNFKVPNKFNELGVIDFQIIQPDGTFYESYDLDELLNNSDCEECTGITDFRFQAMYAFDKTCDEDVEVLFSLKEDDVCDNFKELYQKIA